MRVQLCRLRAGACGMRTAQKTRPLENGGPQTAWAGDLWARGAAQVRWQAATHPGVSAARLAWTAARPRRGYGCILLRVYAMGRPISQWCPKGSTIRPSRHP